MSALLCLFLLQPPAAKPLAPTVTFDPAAAKPGQTVTLTVTVVLPAGRHTYPTRQPDKAAADFVTTLKFPAAGPVVFVGDVTDPVKFTAKSEPELGIKELRTVAGTVTFTRKLVVNPRQAAGPLTVSLPELKLPVCEGDRCEPAKLFKPAGTLTVLPGPAVAVEPKYAAAVEKALAGL